MPSWLTGIASAVFSLVEKPLTSLAAYLAGLRQGRTEQKRDQADADLEAARKANAARNSIDHDPGSVRDDKRNRDTD